jgi:RNA polymerase sigma-70 factor (ECF subfamily)
VVDRRGDAELVDGARQGDLDAFEVLFRRHSPRVHTVALRVLGDGADAEEATQDTFVQVWKSLASFRGESRFTTWVHRICVNRCSRTLRRRGERLEPLPELADRRPGPAEMTVLRDELAAVESALSRLTDEQRSALVLREFGGLSYQEVAVVLGTSLTAARSRIRRARLELIRLMEGGGWQRQPLVREDADGA